jgi:hypothetical protein
MLFFPKLQTLTPLLSRSSIGQCRALRHHHDLGGLRSGSQVAQSPGRDQRITAIRVLPSGQQDVQASVQAPVLQRIVQHHRLHFRHVRFVSFRSPARDPHPRRHAPPGTSSSPAPVRPRCVALSPWPTSWIVLVFDHSRGSTWRSVPTLKVRNTSSIIGVFPVPPRARLPMAIVGMIGRELFRIPMSYRPCRTSNTAP